MYKFISKYYLSFFVILPAVLFTSSCSDKGVIEEDKFVKVYADLVIANDSLASDTTKMFDEFRYKIFERHEISEEQYQATVEFYNKEPERWRTFFDKVIKYVEILQKNGKI